MSRTRTILLASIVGVVMVMALAMPAWAPLADFGCTPGFWKNHLEDWPPTGYSPSDDFSDVFGVSSNIGPTLIEALEEKGGGEKALARHAVAALLNVGHPDVAFPLTEDEVIGIVQAGYYTGDFESAKNLLEAANDEGCPL